ncbi:contractile injection system tape measure protein [Aquimarina sp. MMG016]|uniref:contractile injection system tape measure protein n=1 Tax=Aquimarina sp. MMG016 TaxID=2822690 RepID=UPI001B39F6E2|nr:contractile injection system tape measure protein [Aquimarina sp. MMG016]MBQ4820692.1 hypothetical protein [Aquimarina sp. MMG016]
MRSQRHIINKQIIEIQLSQKGDTFAMQQKLSKLYQDQLVPVLDAQLDTYCEYDQEKHYQMDRLTIDLGKVNLEDMSKLFNEKLKEVLSGMDAGNDLHSNELEEFKEGKLPKKTPLKAVSYYLQTGRLPWWADQHTKSYVLEQLDQLLAHPDPTFKKLLSELTSNSVYIDRFIGICTSTQLEQSLQILANYSVKDVLKTKEELIAKINQTSHQNKLRSNNAKITKTFWITAFEQVSRVENYQSLKEHCIQKIVATLDIHTNNTKNTNNDVSVIRTLTTGYKKQYPTDKTWQYVFEKLSGVVNHAAFYQLSNAIHKELRQLLEIVKGGDKTKNQAYLNRLEVVLKQLQSTTRSTVIEKQQSQFEDTDFISIENAGLLLLWPFLPRFFENLGLMEDKTFIDENAKHKAAFALQYLCDADEFELFEGVLPLNKVLCGVSIEEPLNLTLLSEEEKEIANGLLLAVIKQGPHWKNLSVEGLRASYLCRKGSLRIQDSHWLLQVQKETHDITLQKLPWSCSTIKLPWMKRPMMVEWL